jgi:hypothetical protein
VSRYVLRPRSRRWVWPAVGVIAVVLGLIAAAFSLDRQAPLRRVRLRQFWSNPAAHTDWQIVAGARCGEAPFLAPTDGYIGFVWGDSFRVGQQHQGVDIFGPTGPDGLDRLVVAAYDGYLTLCRTGAQPSSSGFQRPARARPPGLDLLHAHGRRDGRSFIDPAFPPGTTRKLSVPDAARRSRNYSADPRARPACHALLDHP